MSHISTLSLIPLPEGLVEDPRLTLPIRRPSAQFRQTVSRFVIQATGILNVELLSFYQPGFVPRHDGCLSASFSPALLQTQYKLVFRELQVRIPI